MRQTFGMLLQTSKDFVIDPKTTAVNTNLTNTELFLKRQINQTVQFTSKKMNRVFKTLDDAVTDTTVADTQYYDIPAGADIADTVTIDNDTTIPPLIVVQNQTEWDRLNSYPQTSGIPTHIYFRARDYGLFPIPKDEYTLTWTGRNYPKNMYADDYTTGTIATTTDSAAVVGSGTTFTAAMVGRYLVETDSTTGEAIGNFYRISAFTDATHITLERTFQETSLSGASYLIGESPNLPPEIHEFIPYRVAGVYYATMRRSIKQAQPFFNMYWTGDFDNPRRTGRIEGGVLGFIQTYAQFGSDNSQIIDMTEPKRHHYLSEEWETVTT